MTFRYASISCTDNSILPIFCHDLVKCITAYIQLSKHLKGQLGPPLSHVTFFGPKEVSWRLGAPLSHITFFGSSGVSWAPLIFVIFLHRQNFWRIKFTPKKRVNYDKIHSKLPFFCAITAKYTVNCQFFALNL